MTAHNMCSFKLKHRIDYCHYETVVQVCRDPTCGAEFRRDVERPDEELRLWGHPETCPICASRMGK